jgi:hypothetical protein
MGDEQDWRLVCGRESVKVKVMRSRRRGVR